MLIFAALAKRGTLPSSPFIVRSIFTNSYFLTNGLVITPSSVATRTK